MSSSIRSRVAAGIAYLNKRKHSKKWMSRINLERLNIANGRDCIMGQLYNPKNSYKLGWTNCLEKAGLFKKTDGVFLHTEFDTAERLAAEYGFYPLISDNNPEKYRANYNSAALKLTREWRRQIEAALAA